jgi:N-acyl-D-amino-acid deacylase
MTSLAVENTGLSERGEIREGYFADLVLFDAETVLDRATPDKPNLTSVGIVGVWVNGARVYSEERVTGNRPGHVLRRVDN